MSQPILPSFDYSSYNEGTVIVECVARIQNLPETNAYARFAEIPPIPDSGLTSAEIETLEDELGHKLTPEYREILLSHKYICLDDSRMLFGGGHNVLSYGRSWLSDAHEPGRRWLVIGQYWVYADGDDLLMDPNTGEVYVYLHEYGGKIEVFADDAKKALYRLTYE